MLAGNVLTESTDRATSDRNRRLTLNLYKIHKHLSFTVQSSPHLVFCVKHKQTPSCQGPCTSHHLLIKWWNYSKKSKKYVTWPESGYVIVLVFPKKLRQTEQVRRVLAPCHSSNDEMSLRRFICLRHLIQYLNYWNIELSMRKSITAYTLRESNFSNLRSGWPEQGQKDLSRL